MEASEQKRFSSFGFLSVHPLTDLPRFEKVSRLARELPELIASGTDALRGALDALPFIDVTNIEDEREVRALVRDYHFLQSAYVLAEPHVKRVPFSLAVPSHQLSKRLGQRPVLSYASAILDNWQLVAEGDFSIDNIRPIRTFTRASSEAGFYMPHVLIEQAAGQALARLTVLLVDVQKENSVGILKRLLGIEEALIEMRMFFRLIAQNCEPGDYYKSVRPWLCGFQEMIFEGVDEYKRPQSFIGASGAQSPILSAIDAALGIRHDHYFSAYVEKLRTYMRPSHVAFIEELEGGPSLRTFVVSNTDLATVRAAYNRCIENVRLFRLAHGSFATQYVTVHDAHVRGTGGSIFQEFFAQYVKDTEAAFV